MSFLDDESSAEDNRPIEYYEVELPTETYRFVSANRDYEIGSYIYEAIPIARTDIQQYGAGKQTDVSVVLPVNHALVTRYLSHGIPPRYMNVTVYRKQIRSGESERIWGGRVTSLGVEGKTGKLRVPSRASELMLRVLPQLTRGKLCPHILYDSMCQITRASFEVTATVIYVNGREVRVDMGDLAKSTPWSEAGEVVHVTTTERMTISAQVDLNPGISSVAQLTMQLQIPRLSVGDTVKVYAGCDHTIQTCHTKFNNRQHYGGMHHLNTKGAINYVWHIRDIEE